MASNTPIMHHGPLHAMEIVVPEIRKALQRDDTELALAFLPVIEWGVEQLGLLGTNPDAGIEFSDDE